MSRGRLATGLVTCVLAGAIFIANGIAQAMPRTQWQDAFSQCVAEETKNGREPIVAEYMCCPKAGGTWVQVYDEDGRLVDEGCEVDGQAMPHSYARQSPSPQPSSQPRYTGSTSGTYQQPNATPAPKSTSTSPRTSRR